MKEVVSFTPDIVSLSFEYLLACISEEYCAERNVSIKSFNADNDLTLNKLLLYPFFISLANGHSRALYKLFGTFYSMNFGPASVGLLQLLRQKNYELTYFKVDVVNNSHGVILRDDNIHSFGEIKDAIKTTSLELDDSNFLFEHLVILSDKEELKEIYLAIESGINAINEQSRKTFFLNDSIAIKIQSQYFNELNFRYQNNTMPSIIEYSDLESGNGRPFYKSS